MTVSLSLDPERAVERLRERTRRHNRSLQGELIVILEEAYRRVRASGLRTSGEAVGMVREDRDGRQVAVGNTEL